LHFEFVRVGAVAKGSVFDAGSGEVLGDLSRGGENVAVFGLDESGPGKTETG
jgi:hypothetical protein